jgi:soluble cytochrome b562
MYICTDYLREREGKYYFHPDTTTLSKNPDGRLCYDISKYPSIFFLRFSNKRGEFIEDRWSLGNMNGGTLNLPRYSFDPDKHRRNEWPWEKVESWKKPWGRKLLRRRVLNEEIDKELQTELKKHRKAIRALIKSIEKLDSKLKDDKSIKDFDELETFVVDTIRRVPKDSKKMEDEAKRINREDSLDFWMQEKPNGNVNNPAKDIEPGQDYVDEDIDKPKIKKKGRSRINEVP